MDPYVRHGQQTYRRQSSAGRLLRQLGWRLAGICSQQSRYRAVLRALWRWPAQRRPCETDGVLYLTLRGHAHHVLRRKIGMENNDPVRKEDVKDPIGRYGLAAGERARWRTYSHAVE